jgi:Ca2+-binding EF-hand superfamily protein
MLFPDEMTIHGAIKALDKDKSATIDFEEFYNWWLNNEKFQLIEANIEKTSKAAKLFQKYDENRNGTLEKEEFIKMFQELVDQKVRKNFCF